MRDSGITKAIDLGADLERMYSCEWKAEKTEGLGSKVLSNVVMAGFDITSLFTNIPVNETIDVISNSLFSNCQFFNGLDRSEFHKLLSLSVITATLFSMASYTNKLTAWQWIVH